MLLGVGVRWSCTFLILCIPGWLETYSVAVYTKLLSTAQSSCFSLQFPKIIGQYHHAKQFMLFFLNVYECFVRSYVCIPHMCLVPLEARQGVKSPETGVIDSSELLCDGNPTCML